MTGFRKPFLFFISVSLYLPSLIANSFNIPSIECSDKHLCAYELQEKLNSYYNDLSITQSVDKILYDELSRPQIFIPQQNSKITFVITHGLFLDGAQFSSLYEHLLALDNGPNIISVVLEGHGFDEGNLLDVRYQNWLSSLDNAISMAEQIGEKIVLVGQSTGGLLSTYMAFKYPEKIDGLILVEPAIKVAGLIESTACISPSLSFDLENFRFLIERFASIPDRRKYISPVTGCEVVRTTRHLEDEFSKKNLKKHERKHKNPLKWVVDEARVEEMFKQLNLPIALFNHPHDLVVSPKWNKYLAKFSKGKLLYKEVNSDKYTPIAREQIDLETSNQQEINHDLKNIKHGDYITIERMTADPDFQKFIQEQFLN
ncbi:MAG: alpha/beta fold hydrolase [Bdellovibrionota bacterium]|nr:alpha/beta fold hydrolase [Bdellovibrionota bacterium]